LYYEFINKERENMRSYRDYRANWSGGAKTPDVTTTQWNMLAIPAAVLAVMAILQIISFSHFKDWLDSIRVGWPAVVAVVIIVAEVWGAASLLRVSMGYMWRFIGLGLAIAVTAFWFVENLYLATSTGGQLPSSGLFGNYLNQQPGWWTVLEISVLLFWAVYAAELLKVRGQSK
jgi:hypothetical protein